MNVITRQVRKHLFIHFRWIFVAISFANQPDITSDRRLLVFFLIVSSDIMQLQFFFPSTFSFASPNFSPPMLPKHIFPVFAKIKQAGRICIENEAPLMKLAQPPWHIKTSAKKKSLSLSHSRVFFCGFVFFFFLSFCCFWSEETDLVG